MRRNLYLSAITALLGCVCYASSAEAAGITIDSQARSVQAVADGNMDYDQELIESLDNSPFVATAHAELLPPTYPNWLISATASQSSQINAFLLQAELGCDL